MPRLSIKRTGKVKIIKGNSKAGACSSIAQQLASFVKSDANPWCTLPESNE